MPTVSSLNLGRSFQKEAGFVSLVWIYAAVFQRLVVKQRGIGREQPPARAVLCQRRPLSHFISHVRRRHNSPISIVWNHTSLRQIPSLVAQFVFTEFVLGLLTA
jgi:hypothetical protein